MSGEIPGWVYSMLFGVTVAVLVALAKQTGWEERADTLLAANPLLNEIGTYETMSVRNRINLVSQYEPRLDGSHRKNVEEFLEANGFQEPKRCEWIGEKSFDDLSDYSTCYLRTVEFGNCEVIYLIAAKYDANENLDRLTGTNFTLQVC